MIVKEDDKFVAVVDLGDGSAPQKFYGDTHQELIDKLVQAQTHATRTIREQKQIIKVGKVTNRGTLEDDGLTKEQALDISGRFMKSHPDYIQVPDNEDILLAYLDTRGYAFTENNLNMAYEDTKEFLKLKQVEIPQSERVQTRNRQSQSGLPSNTSTPVTPKKTGLSRKEIDAMPLHIYNAKLRDPEFKRLVDEAK